MAAIQGRAGYIFQNWMRTVKCKPKLYFEPENREHIQQILLRADELGLKVRVVGSGHSSNDQACTTDYLISLNKMNRIIKVDKAAMTVQVEGGAKVEDITEILAENDLALSTMDTAADVTIAGAISTGTQGTGLNYTCVSAYVLEMEMMTADGSVWTISRDMDEDLYRAAVLAVGTLGVILTVTMRCEPAFNLEEKHIEMELDDALDDIVSIAGRSQRTSMLWIPHAGTVIRYVNKTTEKPRREFSVLRHLIFGGLLLEPLLWLSTYMSFISPWVNQLFYRYLAAPPSSFVDRSDKVMTGRYICVNVGEWAIPINDAASAIKNVRDFVNKCKSPLPLVMEVKFVGKDDLYLSLANGRNMCIVIVMVMRPFGKDVDCKQYWMSIRDVFSKYDRTFKWTADTNFLTREEIRKIYPDLEKFHETRKNLDPKGLFLTPQVAELIAA